MPSLLGLLLLVTLALLPAGVHAQTVVGPAYVTRVVEGDTLYAEIGGRLEAVRYLGVNAPRIEHPTWGPTRYAEAAREANRMLVEGKWIHLVFEGPQRDASGRLLAHVWMGDVFVDAALASGGWAEAAATARPTRYRDYLRWLEASARQEARGIWRDPEAARYHRPRPPEGTPEARAHDERAGPATGGRVFSAPAPFAPPPAVGGGTVPAAPGLGAAPGLAAPAGPALRSSPSYIVPRGATSTTRTR
jgi:micrococcal nuclease